MRRSIILLLLATIFTLPIPSMSQRIISLAPGLTEIIFRLGFGNNIVGVTKFCDYPAAAIRIDKVGGFIDLNMEKIVSLKPDIIFHYPEHLERIKFLGKRSRLISLKHRTLSDLYGSIIKIADVLNAKNRGIKLVNKIKSRLKHFSKASGPKKEILIIAGRSPDQLRNIMIVGKTDFLSEILEMAGGINSYRGNLQYPTVSMESIMEMNPDIVIEFSAFFKKTEKSDILSLWSNYPQLKAVANHRILVVKDQFWLRPGPRVALIAEKLYEIINGKNR